MPDITLCDNGEKCKKHKNCYRWIAKPDEHWQSYSNYYDKKKCKYYWAVKEEK